MKAKLLKKVRKRFLYYWNLEGVLFIIDLYKQKDIRLETELDCVEEFHRVGKEKAEKMLKDDPVKISLSSYIDRTGLLIMVEPFGYSWSSKTFSYRKRIAERLFKKGTKILQKPVEQIEIKTKS